MGWSPTAISVVVSGSAMVSAAVAVVAFRQRPDPLAVPLAGLMLAVVAWAVPHAISFGYDTVGPVAFWHRLRYPGTVSAPVLYLVVALKYGGYERWLSRRTYAALAAVPAATVAAVWTSPYHGLFWQSLSVVEVAGASVLVPVYGPWYWVNLLYLYAVTAAGLVIFAAVTLRSGPVYRQQAVVMFTGGLIPLAANAVVNLGDAFDPTIDFTTVGLAVTGVMFAVALFYLDLLEIRPVARERLVEELDDGVVVIGPEGRIRDFNPAAARILGGLDIKQPADEVLPARVTPDGGELVAEIDGTERLFRVRSTTFADERGRNAGRIVYLSDVTEVVEREQRISVLNRVLRHNIRNEMAVIQAQLDLLAERGVEETDIERARRSSDHVVSMAERARHVERMLTEGETGETVDASAVAEEVIRRKRETHPEAVIEHELASDGRVRAVDRTSLAVALAELVENAVVHADRDPPEVAVRVVPGGEYTRVAVADNGPGVPAGETAPLDSTVERPLEHASGLGLWLVKWFVSLSGGDISFGDNDPRGSVVTMRLPRAAE